jgi:hypothetical protein
VVGNRAKGNYIVVWDLAAEDAASEEVFGAIDTIVGAFAAAGCGYDGNCIGPDRVEFYVAGEREKVQQAVAKGRELLRWRAGQWRIEAQDMESPGTAGGGRKPRRYDIWAIPLPRGEYGYLQVLERDEDYLHLVRVFSLGNRRIASAEEVLASPSLFPPIFTYVTARKVLQNGLEWIGNVRVPYEAPVFRHSKRYVLFADEKGADWVVWTRKGGFRIAGEVTAELRELEFLVTWPLQEVAMRIAGRIGPADAPGEVDRLRRNCGG